MYKDVICDNSNIRGEGQSCTRKKFLYTMEAKLVAFQTRLVISLRYCHSQCYHQEILFWNYLHILRNIFSNPLSNLSFMSPESEPGTILGTLHMQSHWILSISLLRGYYYSPFTDEEAENQEGNLSRMTGLIRCKTRISIRNLHRLLCLFFWFFYI